MSSGSVSARRITRWLRLLGLTGVAWCATATPRPAVAAVLFDAWTHLYETGVGNRFTTLSDLDGDGELDVVAQDGGGGVSVLLGHGNGSFGTSLDLTVGSTPCSPAAIGDLNGDAKPDLAIGVLESSVVAVFLSHGDGTFGPRTDFATGGSPQSVAIGELNGDAMPDIVVANAGSASISVLLGHGDGTFAPRVDVDAGLDPVQLGLTDFNRDGHLDAAVLSRSTGLMSVLAGLGDGTFAPRTEWDNGVPPFEKQLVVGDITGDGNPDLTLLGLCNTVRLGLGDGAFGPPVVSPEGECFGFGFRSAFAGTGDLDGDGKLDVAVVTSGGKQPGHIFTSMSILTGTPEGYLYEIRFVTKIGDAWSSRIPPVMSAMGDLNHDGHGDLVMAGAFGASAAVLLARKDGAFPERQELRYSDQGHSGGPTSLSSADLNSDGRSDLLVGIREEFALSVAIYRSSGTNNSVGLTYPFYPGRVAVGDLNGDGVADLAVVNEFESGPCNTTLGRPNGTFAPPTAFTPGFAPTSFAIGDFDHDGHGDLAVTERSRATLSALRGNGNGAFGASVLVSSDGPFGAVQAVDLDLDGEQDLVVPSGSDVAVLRGRGDGEFDSVTRFPAGGSVNELVVADFNADDRLDVGATLVNGTSVLLGLANGTLAPPRVTPGRAARAIVAADLDGDGRVDLAVNSTGISIMLGNGDGTFGERTNLGADFSGNSGLAILGPDAQNRLTLATLGATDPAVILMPGLVDLPVEVLLLMFEAMPSAVGIQVRWRIQDSADGPPPVLERADREAGPWTAVTGERRGEGEITVVVDDAVLAGHAYFYRLVVASQDGAIVFGPLSATSGAITRALSLVVGPNPARRQARFDFDLPSESHVRLTVLDLQGRVLATLDDGSLKPGRHHRAWDGMGTPHGSAGAYFVRLETLDRVVSRRFVLLP